MTKVKYSLTLYKLEFWTNHYVIVQVVSILNLNNKILKSLNVIKRRKKLSINWLTRISFFQRKNKKFFNLFSSNAIWSHHIISDRLISKRFLRDLRRFLSVELLISGVILLQLPLNKVMKPTLKWVEPCYHQRQLISSPSLEDYLWDKQTT